ncbi:DUF4010 domain-containing protein [Rhodococcus opacus]|uniref:DUF4010 domain-containing protein n=1 Tax=Rhodococcus opacus TaxID=37919 RepID=UPI0002A34F82|nr:DUF4010 domain-containing protein [Rhodococcus opacus]ELB90345.1 hypothetical protein Rwratislav_24821 [Rhodococcus wratislaviensis IFP 2016]MDX5964941.1 DUF4010 domain-containing protein [Rhodococcus opacus]UNN01576.1 DUF4010 domain-containing protein [Rhodococcus opacus]UNN05081.1 DUF4010 domain-containing protein [Rhodococcus opacus]UZG52452.1 DUF4010 domain-containing protein [Rhodococcus opacus]
MTNRSTIVLAVAITRVVNVEVSSRLALVFGDATMMIAAETAFLLLRRRGRTPEGGDGQEQYLSAGLLDRPISIPATLSLAGILLLLLVVTRGAADVFGGGGAVAAAAVGGLADAHSAALAAASATGESLSVDAATMAATVAVARTCSPSSRSQQ